MAGLSHWLKSYFFFFNTFDQKKERAASKLHQQQLCCGEKVSLDSTLRDLNKCCQHLSNQSSKGNNEFGNIDILDIRKNPLSLVRT